MTAFHPLRSLAKKVALSGDWPLRGGLKKDVTFRRCFLSRVVPGVFVLIGVYAVLRHGDEWMEAVGRFILALN